MREEESDRWRGPLWCVCSFSGRDSANPRDLWRREEADQHRHGADHQPVGALPGRADNGPGRQHRQLGAAVAQEVHVSPRTRSHHSNRDAHVCPCASRMANNGRTIILSIHQPRYSIYKLFDSLTLLVNGKQVRPRLAPISCSRCAKDNLFSQVLCYSCINIFLFMYHHVNYDPGVSRSGAECFGLFLRHWWDRESQLGRLLLRSTKSVTGRDVLLLGYTCEAHNNPADFFLDVINGDSSAVTLSSKNPEGAFQNSSHRHIHCCKKKSQLPVESVLHTHKHTHTHTHTNIYIHLILLQNAVPSQKNMENMESCIIRSVPLCFSFLVSELCLNTRIFLSVHV